MQSAIDHLEELAEKASQLATTKARIIKLRAVGSISENLSSIASVLIITVGVMIAILMLSIGMAIWIGHLLQNSQAGFFIMGGFYLFTGFLLFIFRRQLVKGPLANRIIRALS